MSAQSELQEAVRALGAALGVKGARIHLKLDAVCDQGTLAEMLIALDGPECEALFQITVPGVRTLPGELTGAKNLARLTACNDFSLAVVNALRGGQQ